ncbi:MAG: transpeptidase family protein [Cytophagaceae bacterium]|nr:transpeptidase family protein [Cytophagaceae bacterium]MDW8455424.1 penicillin-binding protein [Cytophagaceae bacterium]
MTDIKKNIVLRARLAFLPVFLFCIAIAVKILRIQIHESEKWEKIANEKLIRYQVVKATRGNIYSDNGSLLATSIPFYRLCMDPSRAKDEVFRSGIDSLCLLLSQFYKDKTKEEYYRKINEARRENKEYIILNKTPINYQTKKMMEKWPLVREGKYGGGIIFEKTETRFRPFAYLAMRTIGFINENNTGAGLEYSYNKYLAGRDGQALFMKMAGNNWRPIHDHNEILPEQGVDIQTTIDINIQDVAESSLHNHLLKHDADYGCVVLMEVHTGEIKAIANLGKTEKGTYAENYNYAIGNHGLTEPGSTFKLASLLALFEDSDIKLTDTVFAHWGKYKYFDRVMTDANPNGYGKLTVKEAFEKSSNIAVSKLVYEHFHNSPKKFIKYIRDMGIATPIEFQMHGEAIPYIKDPSDKTWSGVTLPWMSIGYELKMTPLNTLAFYNAIANDGKMIQPMIVKEVRRADKVLEKFSTQVLVDKICSDRSLQMAQEMLEGVVERGTAKNINNAIYKIAGKTGTAQIIKNGSYTKSYYTSFVGYFPANRPKYSCIVAIYNPKGFSQYGADVAAPVFKEIADKLYAVDLELHQPMSLRQISQNKILPFIQGGYYKDIHYLCDALGVANYLKETSSEGEWVSSSAQDNAAILSYLPIQKSTVPDATGMTLRDALYLLENMGLKVHPVGRGRVYAQSLTPGSRFNNGSTITLYLK